MPTDEEIAKRAKDLGVPVVPKLPPTSPSRPGSPINPTVGLCGECGLELKASMHYACGKSNCPTGLGPVMV